MLAIDGLTRLRGRGIVSAVLLVAISGCGEAGFTSRPTKITFDKINCRALALSPDGNRLAVGGSPPDVTVYGTKLWDGESGDELLSINDLGSREPQFSPDGAVLVTGGWFGEVTLWNAKTGEKLSSVAGHRSPVWNASFSPNGWTIATAAEDGLVKLWAVESLAALGTIKAHSEAVDSLAFSPDSQLLAIGTGNTAHLWSVQTLQEVGPQFDCEWPVWFVTFSPDGKSLVTAGRECSTEGGLTLWDLATRTARKTLPGHRSAAFAPTGALWATTTAENATVVLWDQKSGEEKSRFAGNQYFEPQIAFSPDGQTLAIGLEGITLIDVDSGHSRRLPIWAKDLIDSLRYSADGKKLAARSIDRHLAVVEVASGRQIVDLGAEQSMSLAFSADATRIITSDYAEAHFGSIAILNALSGEHETELHGHLLPVTAVAFASDGRMLASGSLDRTVRLWDLTTNDGRGVLEGHGANVYQVVFAPNGTHLATASERVRIWDLQSLEIERTLDDLSGLVYSAAYSPKGDLFAAGGQDGKVVIWETANWEKRGQIKAKWAIRSLAFSPDGGTLAIAGGRLDHGIIEL